MNKKEFLMKLKIKKPKMSKVLSTCCWCGKRIGSENEVFSLGCRKQAGIDISKYEEDIMPLTILSKSKTLWTVVPPADSDARKEGEDFVFVLCSVECGKELKEALQTDIDIGDIIRSVNPD
jgi:hypothetical protein